MNFNLLTSKTFWGALVTAGGLLVAADWSHGLPFAAIAQAVGVVVAAIGVRSAIAANGVGSNPAAADQANGGK
jgi:hypothetical protein